MSIYVIAQLSITDRAAYGRYQERFMAVLKPFKGRLLAADECPLVLEGTWERDRVVLLFFHDETDFREWAESAEYQEIARDRKAGASAIVLLVHGISSPG